jgi:hypothetical protein
VEPWLAADEETRRIPPVDFDVEEFAKERLRKSGFYDEQGSQHSEDHLSDYLYGWWKKGGKFGDVDVSGDYLPDDDDAASIISQATTSAEDAWSDMSEGQRTPTQQTWSFDGISQDTSSGNDEDTIDLVRLEEVS